MGLSYCLAPSTQEVRKSVVALGDLQCRFVTQESLLSMAGARLLSKSIKPGAQRVAVILSFIQSHFRSAEDASRAARRPMLNEQREESNRLMAD